MHKFILHIVIYSVYTHLYISIEILYILRLHYGNMFRPRDGHHQTNKEHILRYKKVNTQWDPISFTVKVKLAYDELLFETKTLKYNGN